MVRIRKNIIYILVDLIRNFLNWRYKNCVVDRKENYKFDLGVKLIVDNIFFQLLTTKKTNMC